MSNPVKSVKNTKELAIFVARLANAVDGALADGHITLADAARVYAPLQAAGAAFDEITEVPAEVADLDPAEAAELSAAIAEELDLEEQNVEEVAEKILGVTLQLAAVLLSMRKARAAETA